MPAAPNQIKHPNDSTGERHQDENHLLVDDGFPLQKSADQNGPVTVCMKKNRHNKSLSRGTPGDGPEWRNRLKQATLWENRVYLYQVVVDGSI
jgi:hypothetical protein